MFERFRRTRTTSRADDDNGAGDGREAASEAPTAVRAPRDDEALPATAVREPRDDEESPPAGAREREAREREADRQARFHREPDGRTAGGAPTDRGALAEGEAAVDPRRRRAHAPVVGEDTVAAIRERQRMRFGGIRWGSAFFGLLSAVGLASIVLGIVVAAGVALDVAEVKDTANGTTDTIGVGGGIVLLVVLAVAWYAGGYVAGRMARFDGLRQGVGVWAWTVLLGAAAAIVAAIGGDEYNVLTQLNLPNLAVGDASLTTGGIIALVCALVVTLVAAVAGGKAGELFHRRVDRHVAAEYVEPI
jgi:hypothetical protein